MNCATIDATETASRWGRQLTRNISSLKDQQFDVLIVGGGSFGACAAWEAVLRGYSVALIEANDFGSGTSANSFKFLHGGIRYLQHLDLRRLWSSCKERSAMLRIAPHLVKPLQIAMPTYGHGLRGKEFLGAGFLAYDLLTVGKNRGIYASRKRIPPAQFMGRNEVLDRFGFVNPTQLTGAAVFSDAQMYHPPRLVFSFVQSAISKGACVHNYVQAKSFIRKSNRIMGVLAQDRLTGESFEIRSKIVLNAGGPWSERLFRDSEGRDIPDAGVYSRDTCFVIDAATDEQYAVALQGSSIDTGAVIDRGARHLFVVPWRGKRLIGVWHILYDKSPDDIQVSEDELCRFLDEINGVMRGEKIERDQIRMVNAGLVPFGASDDTGQELDFGKKSHLVDSARVHGLEGLITLIGVRHTMARGDSVKAMKIVDKKLRRSGSTPDSSKLLLLGGDVDDFRALKNRIPSTLEGQGSVDLRSELVALYGSGVDKFLKDLELRDLLRRVESADITEAQIKLAVRDEQAVTLGDVVFRRTPLAAAGNPGEPVLSSCARIMSDLLGWTQLRAEKEVQSVIARFPTAAHSGRVSEPEIESLVDA